MGEAVSSFTKTGFWVVWICMSYGLVPFYRISSFLPMQRQPALTWFSRTAKQREDEVPGQEKYHHATWTQTGHFPFSAPPCLPILTEDSSPASGILLVLK